jgi:hypothetical protein
MHVRLKHVALGASALLPWAVATPARATFTIAVTNANVGKVAMPSASGSTFTYNPSTGVVTQTGTGVFVGTPNTKGTVTISCTGGASCNSTKAKVVLTSVSVSSPVTSNAAFTVAMGTASAVGALPAAGSPYTFTIGAIGNNSSKSFFVGSSMAVPGSTTANGSGSATWRIVASSTTGTSAVTNSTAQSLITTLKPMAVSKTSDLAFGVIVRPPSGTGTASMTPAGVLSLPAGGFSVGAHNAAAFIVTGQASTLFSFSLASSFLMSGSAGTLTATLIPSATYTALVTALDGAGSFSLGVGASFPLGSATPTGAYTGSFSVLAIYN